MQPRDPQKEIWEGQRLGLERASAHLGIEEAKDSNCFFKAKELENILNAHRQLYYRFGLDKERDTRIFSTVRRLIERGRS